LFGERTQEGGPKILCGIVPEDSRLYSACIASLLQKTTQQRIIIAFSECFPDVCPEPVLAKQLNILVQHGVFRTANPALQLKGQSTAGPLDEMLY
jgi:hypothetical protein